MFGHAPADSFDVVVVGSLNLDLVVRTERHAAPGETVVGTDYHEYPGGKGLNQAVAAARAGARVALVGAVGADPAGDRLCEIVRSEGVSDRWLTRSPDLATGRALITVSHTGENSIVVIAGANATTRWEPSVAPTAPVVLGQLEVPVSTIAAAFEHARRRRSTTILNPAPATPLDAALLATCTIVVPNEHEIELLGGVEQLLRDGVATVITTLGDEGLRVDAADHSITLPAYDVDPVDTTGAGDAFCGNLAARLAGGDDLEPALRWASAAGALATTSAGAVPSLPSHSDVRRLIG